MPVYRIEREMPAREFHEWLQVLQAERSGGEPPGVEDVGVEAMAAALGVRSNGS